MPSKLVIWCLLSALFVAGWSARLVTARLSEIERNASAMVVCGNCIVSRALRVRTVSHWLEGSLASAVLALGLGNRRLSVRWRYGCLSACAVGTATLTVYFVEMV